MFPSVSPDGRRVAPVLVLSKLAIHRGGPAVESHGLFPIYRARAVYDFNFSTHTELTASGL